MGLNFSAAGPPGQRDDGPDRLDHHRFTPLPIQLTHVLALHSLPEIHAEPFDRLLIAQSKLEDVHLLSSDAEIARYDVKIIW